jgi:hypothetical protein
VKRRPVLMVGLVLCGTLFLAAVIYLVSVGAGVDTVSSPLTPTETYLGGGGLLAGASGLAVTLGLLLRPAEPAAGAPTTGAPTAGEMPAD